MADWSQFVVPQGDRPECEESVSSLMSEHPRKGSDPEFADCGFDPFQPLRIQVFGEAQQRAFLERRATVLPLLDFSRVRHDLW
jgi:hypothetical protein